MHDSIRLAKAYLKGIPTKKEFLRVIDELLITDIERQVLIEVYLEHKSLDYIADETGYAVQTIKRYHLNVLRLISNYVYDKSRGIS